MVNRTSSALHLHHLMDSRYMLHGEDLPFQDVSLSYLLPVVGFTTVFLHRHTVHVCWQVGVVL